MPQSNGRLAIAFLVVAAGVAVAWTFRQSDTSAPTEDDQARGIVYRESPPPVTVLAEDGTPTSSLSVPTPFATETPNAQASAPTEQTFAAASADGLINIVPRESSPSSEAVPHTARRIPPRDDGWGSPTLSANPPQPPNMNAFGSRTRKHKIADGDSLESLADYYLGDAGRAQEIYELNRGVLPAPDVLRIGTTIVIPANN